MRHDSQVPEPLQQAPVDVDSLQKQLIPATTADRQVRADRSVNQKLCIHIQLSLDHR